MRLKNTLILLVIAAVFLVYFLAVEQPRHRTEMEESERSTKISELQRESIYHVAIWRADDTLSFTREGAAWRMTEPVRDKADAPTVNTLIASALGARIERTLAPGETDAAAYGLDPAPDAVLRLQTVTRDTALTIHLGGHNITKSHFYARVDSSQEVLLLPAGLRRYATQKVKAFRDDQLIDFPRADARRFRIITADRTLQWAKDSLDRWTALIDGDTIIADGNAIDAILRRLRGIRVREFLSDRTEDRSVYFPEQANVLSIWTGSEETEHSVYFSAGGADTCHARVAGSDRIVSIGAAILAAFDKTYDDLRDRNVLHFDRDEVARIEWNTPDTMATIIHTGTEWAFANPAMGSIDQVRVNELFLLLQELKFDEIRANRMDAASERELRENPLKLTLYNRQENVLDELSCSPRPDDESSFLATSRSSRLLGQIEKESLTDLDQTFRSLRSQ
jgi:hypothetical protein